MERPSSDLNGWVPEGLLVADFTDRQRLLLERPTAVAWVGVAAIFVDRTYARPLGLSKLAAIERRGFSERKLGVIHVSRREDGRYACVDGAHRCELCRRHGVPTILARVYEGLTLAEEADLFEALNTINNPTSADRFRARLARQEPRAVAIRDVLAGYGLLVSAHAGSKTDINSVAETEALFEDLGADELNRAIGVLHAAWGRDPAAYHGTMLAGMRQFWIRYGGMVDAQRLAAKLQNATPRRVLAEAKAQLGAPGTSAGTQVGKLLRAYYNLHLRAGKLPEWVERPGSSLAVRRRGGSTAAEGSSGPGPLDRRP